MIYTTWLNSFLNDNYRVLNMDVAVLTHARYETAESLMSSKKPPDAKQRLTISIETNYITALKQIALY